jgi:hypothetical protein
MRTILGSTKEKNYHQLARAFSLTCIQRYGVQRAVELCKDDALEDRSQAIADLVRDEMEAVDQQGGDPRQGPMMLLHDEEEVQRNASKLSWLFEPYLQGLYEHRRWKEIERFEGWSSGARLVAALTFATARTGELLSEEEARQLESFHTERRQWLAGYALNRRCDYDCRTRMIDFMLSTVQEAEGQYDQVLRQALLRPRSDSGHAVAQIHTRLLWCQIDPDDLSLLRDRVLVPTVRDALASPPKEAAIVDDLISVFAVVAPPPNDDATALASYNAVRASLRQNQRLDRLFVTREAEARRQRANPPPMIRRQNFCGAPETAPETSVR